MRDVLEKVYVRQFLNSASTFVSLRPSDSLAVVLDRLDGSLHTVLPVVDGENRLVGVVDLEEAHLAAHAGDLAPLVVAEDLMRSDVRPLTPDDTLDRALELFVENDVASLPIVDNAAGRQVLGMIRRQEIAGDYLRYVHGVGK